MSVLNMGHCKCHQRQDAEVIFVGSAMLGGYHRVVRSDTRSTNELPFEYQVDTRNGYVFVWQRGRASAESDVQAMQRDIKEAMQTVGVRLVIFDNRETARPDEWVRATMWTWLSQNVTRAAMIQAEVQNLKRVKERSERNRVSVQAFQDIDEAERWLLSLH